MKNSKNGITLIALVITIIVLLILAGISISLVMGQNGVLTRAEDASNTYSMSSAKEQANMRAAGYISEYTEKVYVDNDLTVGAMTTGEYVLSQINGEEDGDYRYSVSGSTITVTSKTTGEALATGTVRDDGGIAWSDSIASGGNSSNNTNTGDNTQNTSTEPEISDINLLTPGKKVYYYAKDGTESNKKKCVVLYNDEQHGLQLITSSIVGTITLGKNDIKYTTGTDEEKAKNSYNNAVENLNSFAEEYKNTSDNGLTKDARCVGTKAIVTNGRFENKNDYEGMYSSTEEYMITYNANGIFKDDDRNFVEDFEQLSIAGTKKSSAEYWIASRCVVKNMTYVGTFFNVWYINSNSILDNLPITVVANSGFIPQNFSKGLRPVFLLSSNIKIDSGDGNMNPYTISLVDN